MSHPQDFDLWFRKSGRKLVASAKAGDATEDLEDELHGDTEEVDDEGVEPLSDEPMAVLTAVSDHLKQKAELELLSDAIHRGAPNAAEFGPQGNLEMERPGDPTHGQHQLVPADPADMSEMSDSTTFHKLMAACQDDPLFDMDDEQSRASKACRDRQMFLMPLIRSFTSAVRLREQHLSKTSILGKDAVKMSNYHELHHELARARNASLSDGMRQSRARNWQLTQLACVEASDENDESTGAEWQVRVPERLRCGHDGIDGKGCQVVAFRTQDEDWVLNSMLFVIRFVSICQPSNRDIRDYRDSKTVAHL